MTTRQPPRIKVFTTRGSIDKTYSAGRLEVGVPQVQRILQNGRIWADCEVESLCRKDSLNLDDEDRARIVRHVRKESCEHVLIVHGTDTMTQTARALEDVDGKTIVLVGAVQPALFRDSDAAFNVGAAVMAVSLLPCGVYVAMHGRIFDPDKTRKNHDADRFEPL